MDKLHIILPTYRRENLGKIVQSVYDCEPHQLDIRIHILYQWDMTYQLGVGLDKINEGIDLIQDGWIWVLSDDNAIHPKFFKRLWETMQSNAKAECIVFSEERRDPIQRILHASPHNMFSGAIDGTQFVINKSLCGDKKYDYKTHTSCCDGMFIEELYHSNKDRFVFIDEVLTTFNSYDWTQ